MDINTIPTDNLYKFSAISGLLILFFSIYYPMHQLDQIAIEKIKYQTDEDLLILEYEELEEKLKEVTNEQNSLDNGLKATDSTVQAVKRLTAKGKVFLNDAAIEALENRAQELWKRHNQTVEKRIAASANHLALQKKKILQNQMRLSINQSLDNYRRRYLILGAIGVIAGFLMASWGFKNWHQIQKMADQATKIELERNRNASLSN